MWRPCNYLWVIVNQWGFLLFSSFVLFPLFFLLVQLGYQWLYAFIILYLCVFKLPFELTSLTLQNTLCQISNIQLSNIASILFLGLFISIISTSILELRWSGIGIEDWWRNEQFWVIGGVSAHLFAVFQGFLKMVAGLDTNFTVTAKAAEDGEFGDLYIFKWTTLLIPPTTLLIVNMVGVVAGFSDALNKGYEAWGPLFGKVFFSFWVILHLYPFLKGLMGRQNRTPTIVVLWSVLLASVFSLVWVKIDPFVSKVDSATIAQSCISIDCWSSGGRCLAYYDLLVIFGLNGVGI